MSQIGSMYRLLSNAHAKRVHDWIDSRPPWDRKALRAWFQWDFTKYIGPGR